MEETEHIKLNDTLELIFFEMPKLEHFVEGYLEGKEGIETLRSGEKWCIYFMYRKNEKLAELIEDLCQNSEGIMHAEKVAKKISRSEEQWARAIFREKADMDYRSGLANAREDGIEIGREEGLAKGHEDILALMDQGYTAEQIRALLKQK